MPLDLFAGMTTLQKQTALAAARGALIDLSTGSKGVSFSYAQGDGSKAVSYTKAELPNLTMLILQLEVSLGMRSRVRRPIRFAW